MNVDQAAKKLRVCPQTIRNRIARGVLIGKKIGRSHAFDVTISGAPSFSIAEIAKKVHCSPSWIYKLVKRGAIIRTGNRVSLQETYEFLSRRSSKAECL
jgi:DNA-binding Lrp family transcriptional regulator